MLQLWSPLIDETAAAIKTLAEPTLGVPFDPVNLLLAARRARHFIAPAGGDNYNEPTVRTGPLIFFNPGVHSWESRL
jgi:hypothetical protein